MKKLFKCRRELARIIARIRKLGKEYPDEVKLICACEYPPTLETFLSKAEALSKNMQVFEKPWFLVDKEGWPIELVEGRRLKSFTRILVQNIRKIF